MDLNLNQTWMKILYGISFTKVTVTMQEMQTQGGVFLTTFRNALIS